MIDPRMEDHLVGLELELVELVEQRERARVQAQPIEVKNIQRSIDQLQEEMARVAEAVVRPDARHAHFHTPETRSA